MNERDMSLLKAVSEAVKEQLSAIQAKYLSEIKTQSEEIARLKDLIKNIQLLAPDTEEIVKTVMGKITIPEPPALPDIGKMVKDAVSEITLPEAHKPTQLPDISAMVRDAVKAIELPQPEPLPDIGKMVKDAVEAIPAAKDGDHGEDGRDALQIEILPAIDTEKSYVRGTYALHLGGLWRSHQKTTGMNGWECVMDGISDISITQEEERHFTVTAIKSSGETSQKTFSVPVMIYRDIFKDGQKYYPGDNVTWGGSVWYCNEETGDKPGEDGSKGWRLAVKRGRDARAK